MCSPLRLCARPAKYSKQSAPEATSTTEVSWMGLPVVAGLEFREFSICAISGCLRPGAALGLARRPSGAPDRLPSLRGGDRCVDLSRTIDGDVTQNLPRRRIDGGESLPCPGTGRSNRSRTRDLRRPIAQTTPPAAGASALEQAPADEDAPADGGTADGWPVTRRCGGPRPGLRLDQPSVDEGVQ